MTDREVKLERIILSQAEEIHDLRRSLQEARDTARELYKDNQHLHASLKQQDDEPAEPDAIVHTPQGCIPIRMETREEARCREQGVDAKKPPDMPQEAWEELLKHLKSIGLDPANLVMVKEI